MTSEEHFKKRYESGNTPWDIGKPDFNLIETVTKMAIEPCKALDIGCGTGDNSIWLAQKNFTMTGIDISDVAIRQATEKAAKANVKCNFIVVDFLTNKIEGLPFGFVFDRGCFHSLNSDAERESFSKNVADYLENDGLWLSLVGNADERRQSPGPPQRPPRKRFIFTYYHGISWEDVANEGIFADIWPRFNYMLKDIDFLAAHNASFDRSVLITCCEASGLKPPLTAFRCTVELARKTWNIYPTKLNNVCDHLGIPLNHHEAASDAEACALIVIEAYKFLVKKGLSV